MDTELERYLLAIVIILSLIAGLLVTQIFTSAESMSVTFWIIPLVVGLIIGGVTMGVAQYVISDTSTVSRR